MHRIQYYGVIFHIDVYLNGIYVCIYVCVCASVLDSWCICFRPKSTIHFRKLFILFINLLYKSNISIVSFSCFLSCHRAWYVVICVFQRISVSFYLLWQHIYVTLYWHGILQWHSIACVRRNRESFVYFYVLLDFYAWLLFIFISHFICIFTCIIVFAYVSEGVCVCVCAWLDVFHLFYWEFSVDALLSTYCNPIYMPIKTSYLILFFNLSCIYKNIHKHTLTLAHII